jgi:hypothetical protein
MFLFWNLKFEIWNLTIPSRPWAGVGNGYRHDRFPYFSDPQERFVKGRENFFIFSPHEGAHGPGLPVNSVVVESLGRRPDGGGEFVLSKWIKAHLGGYS